MKARIVGRYLGLGNSAAKRKLRRDELMSQESSTITLQSLTTQGTITPIGNFNAELAARQLNAALHDVDVQEVVLTTVLTSHNNHQRQSIKRHYKYMYAKTLESEIDEALGGHFHDVVSALLEPSIDFLVANLHAALVSVRPEEGHLIELLCNRSNEKIRQIKDTYQKKYGRSVELVVKRELTGDLRRLMRALLNNAREEREEIDIEQAHLDARMMVSSGVGTKYGTDDAVVAALLNKRSYAQLRETFLEYKRLSGQEVEDIVEAQFSGTLRHGLLTLVKVVKDPVHFFAEQLYLAANGPRFNDEKIIRILVARSEVDLFDIKEHYLSLYEVKISNVIADICFGDYRDILLKILGC